MNRRRILVLLVVLSLVVSGTALAASGAPTSQFGFKGWPYRQSTNCGTTQSIVWSSKSCDNQTSIPKTQAPAEKPVSTKAPVATPAPTASPSTGSVNSVNGSNGCPVLQNKPTVKPVTTVAPTVKPTTAPSTGNSNCPALQNTPTPKPSTTVAPTQNPSATATPKPSTGGDYTTGSVSSQEAIAYQLLNQDRASNGRQALALDPVLSSLARMKSLDMNANKYFAHTSPTLGSAADMLRSNGYSFNSVGENIAHHATVTKAQAAFMSSTGHRTNILGSQWTKVGIGVCYDSQGFVYVTQLFVR